MESHIIGMLENLEALKADLQCAESADEARHILGQIRQVNAEIETALDEGSR